MLYREIGVESHITNTPGASSEDFLRECSDFIVVERSSLPIMGRGRFYAYFLAKCGISTEGVRKLLRLTGYKGSLYYYGMKDSNACTVQRVALTEFIGDELCLKGKAKLKFIGKTTFVPKKGGFDHNIFAIKFPSSDYVEEALQQISEAPLFPNFFGHQRFGVRRPLNHEIALNQLKKGTLLGKKRGTEVLLAESLQSFIFNRCLSNLLKLGKFEEKMGLMLGYGYERASERPEISEEHFACSLNEAEKLDVLNHIKRGRFLKYQLRPLFIQNPLLRTFRSREKIIALARMPPGSYASIIINEVFKDNEEWIYRKCSWKPLCLEKF